MALVPAQGGGGACITPEARLRRAISEFQQQLSGSEKGRFQSLQITANRSSPEIADVMRVTAELNHEVQFKMSHSQCFGPRVTNVLESAQQFVSIGDVIVGGSQNLIACGIWAVVRFTLQVSSLGSTPRFGNFVQCG